MKIASNSAKHILQTHRNPKKQQGLVLFISLVVLVAMTLAGIALLRQTGAGLGIVGNLAFKENATSGADLGLESGRAWLQDSVNRSALSSDNAAAGFYSSWEPTFNPATFVWNNSSSSPSINDGIGNDVRYVIHRLCEKPNEEVMAIAQTCVTIDARGTENTAGKPGPPPPKQAYYRITARTLGPRNTVSFVQMLTF